MEGGSTGNSRRKSYTVKFKLEVVEVAKEKGSPMKDFLDLNSVMFNNATEWVEQTSFNWKLCLIHNTVFYDNFFCTDNARVIGRKFF